MSEEQAKDGGDNTLSEGVEPISYYLTHHESRLPEKTANELWVFVLIALILALFNVLHYFLGIKGVYGAIALFSAGFLVYADVMRRREKPEPESVRPLMPCESARISITGHRDEINRLSTLVDVPFEPSIFPRVYSGAAVWVAAIVGCFVGVGMMSILDTFIPGPNLTGILSGFAQFLGIPVLWILARLFPTYYRIVPGRLDIMRFSSLTNRTKRLDHWELRTARIHIRFDKSIVEILSHGREVAIRIRGISEPYKFIDALLMGAVSTHQSAPVPDDQLIG